MISTVPNLAGVEKSQISIDWFFANPVLAREMKSPGMTRIFPIESSGLAVPLFCNAPTVDSVPCAFTTSLLFARESETEIDLPLMVAPTSPGVAVGAKGTVLDVEVEVVVALEVCERTIGVVVVVVVWPGTVDGIVSTDSWPRATVVCGARGAVGATVVEVVEVDVEVDVDVVEVDDVLVVVVEEDTQVATTPKFCAAIIAVRVPQ